MDRTRVCQLSEWQAAQRKFTLLDVRRKSVRADHGAELPGAVWLDPEALFSRKDQIARDRPAIVYCAKGHEISQGVVGTLQALSLDARYLVDGFVGWHEARLPVTPL